VKDCTKRMATSFQELEKALKDGNKHKSTGETLMNRDSSRSHCIFTIYIETSEIMKVSKSSFYLFGTLNKRELLLYLKEYKLTLS
jgi:kinesin family protein 3/17